MTNSEVLRKAGDVLRERGWQQFDYGDNGQAVCILGAIGVITGSTSQAQPEFDSARRLLLPVVNDGLPHLWNDEPGRTAAEAMIALDAAYVLALQEEGIEPGDVL